MNFFEKNIWTIVWVLFWLNLFIIGTMFPPKAKADYSTIHTEQEMCAWVKDHGTLITNVPTREINSRCGKYE